jgi:hypothetical protein
LIAIEERGRFEAGLRVTRVAPVAVIGRFAR